MGQHIDAMVGALADAADDLERELDGDVDACGLVVVPKQTDTVTTSDEGTVVLRRLLDAVLRIEETVKSMAVGMRADAFARADVPATTPMSTARVENARTVALTLDVMGKKVLTNRDLDTLSDTATTTAPTTSTLTLSGTRMPNTPSIGLRPDVRAMGYNNRNEIWGVALTVLMKTFVSVYRLMDTSTVIIMDGSKLAQRYREIAPLLYVSATGEAIPELNAPPSVYMAQALCRHDKKIIPEATPTNWLEAMRHPAGSEAMGVLAKVLMEAKKVPEVLMYPMSDLIKYIDTPLVTEIGGKATMNLSTSASIGKTAMTAARICARIRVSVLSDYLARRLSGSAPDVAVREVQARRGDQSIMETGRDGVVAEVVER